jgi:hypothetical protein
MAQIRQAVLILLLSGTLWRSDGVQAPRFFADDPIQAMPAPLNVKSPVKGDVNEVLDFLQQSRKPGMRPAKPAGAVNTLGDVPDSEWFTNRHGARRMTRDALQRGPNSGDPPTPPFTVTGGKSEGITPGFRIKDSTGRPYFVKTDPATNPELVTAAEVIVSKFLYAIGYNTPANDIVYLKLSDLQLSGTAKIKGDDGRLRRMTWRDVEEIVAKIPQGPDGSFRVVASLGVDGENIGPFRFEGTRHDDPNDVVPHEDRRDLRGLYVFSAWLNSTDAKAGNTLDTVVEENGVRFIRHYLIDFGSTLGSDGDRPKDPRFGHEYMVPTPTQAARTILTLGIVSEPWERTHFPKAPAVGNFESKLFDPNCWLPDYPNPAFLSRLPDDDFWAAKQVMAFSDADIRAMVETGKITDPQSTQYITATLAERKSKIGRTFFSKILPLDHFRVENENLLFNDLAVHYGFHPRRSYAVEWSAFDNNAQKHGPIRGSGSTHLPPEARRAAVGAYFSATIAAVGDPLRPVSVYLRKESNGYKVVGIDRAW